MMELVMNNFYYILIAVVILIGLGIVLFGFLHLTPSEQKKRINLVLLDACIKAEEALGSKTGKAKRAQVYCAFRDAMPIISVFITEEKYDKFLDDALLEMKDWFAKNAAAAEKFCN